MTHQSDSARKWQSQDLNGALLTPKLGLLLPHAACQGPCSGVSDLNETQSLFGRQDRCSVGGRLWSVSAGGGDLTCLFSKTVIVPVLCFRCSLLCWVEAIRAKPAPSPCVAPVPVSGGVVGAEPLLGPKSFMIHSSSSGKVFTSSLCKGTVAQRGEVTSLESHSLQEL